MGPPSYFASEILNKNWFWAYYVSSIIIKNYLHIWEVFSIKNRLTRIVYGDQMCTLFPRKQGCISSFKYIQVLKLVKLGRSSTDISDYNCRRTYRLSTAKVKLKQWQKNALWGPFSRLVPLFALPSTLAIISIRKSIHKQSTKMRLPQRDSYTCWRFTLLTVP